MNKIFILFCLLPFSVFAELSRDDLYYIEDQLGKIEQDISTIEPRTEQAVIHLTYIRQICAEILSTLNTAAIGSQLEDMRNKLSGISNRAQTIIDRLNEFLPQIKSELSSANTNLEWIKTEIVYLDDRLATFQSETFQWLKSIDYQLTEIKTAITDGFVNLNIAMSSLQESITEILTTLEEIKITTQNIYDELLSQGLDIKDISAILKNIFITPLHISELKTRFWTYSGSSNIGSPASLSQYVISQYRNTSSNFFNYVSRVLSRSYDLQGITQLTLDNFAFRLFDIQTNFYASIKIQKDISTNVAYIASVITNSHDLLKLISSNVVNIARHLTPTNITDQYETQQQYQIDQITSNYQEHENDMSAYESSLTHIPSKLQKPLDDGVGYISQLSSSSLSVDRLDDNIYAALPDYHSSLSNQSFSLPITIGLTPDVKQILAIMRKCVTTTIWIFTFLFSLFLIQKFIQFVAWIMSLLQPYSRDVFGNTSSGSLYRLMGG